MAKRELIDVEQVISEIKNMDNNGCITRAVNHVCEDIRMIPTVSEQEIVKPYIDKVTDVIEAYICDKEENTVKAQGMCKALELIEATFKEMSESDEEVCEWIKYDYRTVAPRNHDINNPYWRIPENRMNALKYCPYCGKKIEVKE